jgi:[ribosomal protein S5]-alanine N-acetyltransferase
LRDELKKKRKMVLMSIKPSIAPAFSYAGLHLREFRPGDEEIWFDYLRLPDVAQATGWHIASSDELLPLTVKTAGVPAIRFALADEAEHLAGTIGFVDWENGRAEIAYDLAPPWRGKGIAGAACAALCRWGFDQGLTRIEACVLLENRASARVLEKCGFAGEGLLRQARHADGIAREYRLYRLQKP